MAKGVALAATLTICSLAATSCRKNCTCIEMNGREHVFTREEVDEYADGNCGDMVYMFSEEARGAWLRFYSTCSWY